MKKILSILLFASCTATQTVNTDDILGKYIGSNIETIYPKLGTPTRVVKLSDSTTAYIYELKSLNLNYNSTRYRTSGLATSDASGSVYQSYNPSSTTASSATLNEHVQSIQFFTNNNGVIKSYHYSGLPKQVKVPKS